MTGFANDTLLVSSSLGKSAAVEQRADQTTREAEPVRYCEECGVVRVPGCIVICYGCECAAYGK